MFFEFLFQITEEKAMIGIRQKILSGFSSPLVIIDVIGMLTLDQMDHPGSAIDIILKENYRSVIASQKMKEALEKIYNDIFYAFAGKQPPDTEDIGHNEQKFRDALKLEPGNISLPGEGEKAIRAAKRFDSYVKILIQVSDTPIPLQTRWISYNSSLLPQLSEIKALAQQILDMNQANMNDANNAAKQVGYRPWACNCQRVDRSQGRFSWSSEYTRKGIGFLFRPVILKKMKGTVFNR
jgi:two-component system, NtrC family, sensor histidine kinase KinB